LPTSSEDSGGGERLYAIESFGLGKEYRLGELEHVARLVRRALGRSDEVHTTSPLFRAFDDVSFKLDVGDCLGIVGENGSGKSTLVQTIAGITVPTEGELRVRGRVLALLEVATVFHEELTGRENVELFGTVLGLTRSEIRAALPSIAEFSEIDDWHMDTPLKRYSMGMRARLSFAVAMRFPADIYIFDEVMAVVDDHFRAVAMAEIERLLREGRTVLFISHDLGLVKSIANTGLWLDKGHVRMFDRMDAVADAYQEAEEAGLVTR
jgi:lipopolysaccharide transport system ATP-binding protein